MSDIAVVDDNPGARHFVGVALEKSGHSVRELEPTCLFAVLGALHEHTPDLLISDLVMPACPGQTLIRACREDPHLRNLRILLLTAHGDSQLAQFIQGMGNVHYLAKPVSPQELVACVASLLDKEVETDPGWALACSGVVAIVDDSQLSRAFHAACLRKDGYRPVQITPTDLLETVMAIEAAEPALLMVDYLMPRFHGDALIRAIRARESLRDVPILLITAHRSDELRPMLDPLGGVEILYKPITPADLMAKVHEVLP